MRNDEVLDALTPLLNGEVWAWRGLGAIELPTVIDVYGDPDEIIDSSLGTEPAQQVRFTQAGGFAVFVREGTVVMVEADVLPGIEALDRLPEPCASLPEEIYVESAYAHELLFCEQGLLLTVAEHLVGERTREIVRSRGIKTISSSEELGSDLYWSLDSEVNW